METREQIIKGKIEHAEKVIGCIWCLKGDYYRAYGLHPTTVIMSEMLFKELELRHRWYIPSFAGCEKASIFGMDIRIDYNMNDDEIHVALVRAMKIYE
jgi:hypothetical protein